MTIADDSQNRAAKRISPSSLEQKAEDNMLRAAAHWSMAGGGSVWEAPGLLCVLTPVPMRSFNQVFVIQNLSSADDLFESIGRYRQAGARFRVRARAGIARDSEPVLRELGLRRQGGIPCMAVPDAGQVHPAQSALDIRRVEDTVTLNDHVAVVAEAFGWGRADLARVFTPALISAPGWIGLVGYADGEPVASAQALMEDGVTGIYYVATAETHRRKGYGDAITRRAIAEGARRRCDADTLQASPSGYPVYRKMGFVQISEYVTYVPEDAP